MCPSYERHLTQRKGWSAATDYWCTEVPDHCQNTTHRGQFATAEQSGAVRHIKVDTRKSRRPAPLPKGHVRLDGVVRVGPLMSIPAVVQELGVDPEPLFEGLGFDLDRFDDPDLRVPYLAASRLIARCTEATGCEHFGLLVGERAGPSTLGVAGFMLRVAPDVRTALHDLVRHLDLHDEGGVPFVETAGEVSLLGYAIHQPGTMAAAQIYDIAIAMAFNIMRTLCGKAWRATEVLLSRRAPHDRAPYQRFFQAPLRFDAERSAVTFPSRWLDEALASADPLLHRHLEAEASALHARSDGNILRGLRQLLRKTLVTQKTSIALVARQLGVHQRTLNRRLRAEGTTFKREVEAMRYATARQLLGETDMSLARVAFALEYADASAFNRAFKRWAGVTPAQWRDQQGSRAPSGG
jgi:AraC-like DNA-binding protein